jgi:hypothetical protein
VAHVVGHEPNQNEVVYGNLDFVAGNGQMTWVHSLGVETGLRIVVANPTPPSARRGQS